MATPTPPENWEEQLAILENKLECKRQGLPRDTMGNNISRTSIEQIMEEMEIIREQLEHATQGGIEDEFNEFHEND